MKVFDNEVSNCTECYFATDYAICSRINECIYKVDGIHKDCPFKTENSFTEEQFSGIGFGKGNHGNYHMYITKYGEQYMHSIIAHGFTKDGKARFNLVKFAISKLEKQVYIEVSSFPHLEFILNSLI